MRSRDLAQKIASLLGIGGLTVMLIGGTVEFMARSHAERVTQSSWTVPESARQRKNPIAATAASIAKGKALYAEHCAMCHGERGRGDGPMAEALTPKPRSLRDRRRMRAQTDGELFWKIATGNPPMPDFEKTLSEEEIWHVVNYLRSLTR